MYFTKKIKGFKIWFLKWDKISQLLIHQNSKVLSPSNIFIILFIFVLYFAHNQILANEKVSHAQFYYLPQFTHCHPTLCHFTSCILLNVSHANNITCAQIHHFTIYFFLLSFAIFLPSCIFISLSNFYVTKHGYTVMPCWCNNMYLGFENWTLIPTSAKQFNQWHNVHKEDFSQFFFFFWHRYRQCQINSLDNVVSALYCQNILCRDSVSVEPNC